ncbi:DUF3293 domain-containing protein [Caminibacter pacificus]|jgi:hypothetical protein|uniref:DUF3293 domain-containing protein n=1 Tax=Caminibacter pacificus TaxID=1424653 RepID=A0AAJ4UYQ6_9BACT|nr:DUF3293 domain-containing protein [Caminibacter pacificus]NPA87152.1 DUF3293 domain-containing protein [Campylobacterota bacterium]QCI28067.1 DUF3293 domain-containing protein [Caminibacter pacificus]ROR41225.1 uncharacterized protein DUF3293 [Caminibacter pacificus]
MKFNVIGIGDYKGRCIYDEAEDALMIDDEVVVDFKKKYKDYLRYTKFLINNPWGREWISFQFIPSKKSVLQRPFAIITAHNPKNLILNDFLNFIKNTELEGVIKTLGYEYMTSIGELFDYKEESFIIYDIDKDEAIRIANMFDQDSIFYNSGSEITITKCETKEDILKYNYEVHFKGA